MPLLVDVIVAAMLLIFIINGMRHGFVRALCSFLALFVALFGAIYLSKALTPSVSDMVSPYLLPTIEQKLNILPSAQMNSSSAQPDVQTLVKTLPLPETWKGMLTQVQTSQSGNPDAQPSQNSTQWLSQQVLRIVVSAVIFIVAFLLILLLWGILSRSLDLVSRLPVLNFFNRILGGLLGLLKALIFLFLLRWLLCDFWGILPQEILTQTYSYQYMTHLLNALPLNRFFLLT